MDIAGELVELDTQDKTDSPDQAKNCAHRDMAPLEPDENTENELKLKLLNRF